MHYAALCKVYANLNLIVPSIAISIRRYVTLILLHHNSSNISELPKHNKVGKITQRFWVNSRSRIFHGTSREQLLVRAWFVSLDERRVLPGELSSPKFSSSHHFLEGSYSGKRRLKAFLLFAASLGLSSHLAEDILELSGKICSPRCSTRSKGISAASERGVVMFTRRVQVVRRFAFARGTSGFVWRSTTCSKPAQPALRLATALRLHCGRENACPSAAARPLSARVSYIELFPTISTLSLVICVTNSYFQFLIDLRASSENLEGRRKEMQSSYFSISRLKDMEKSEE